MHDDQATECDFALHSRYRGQGYAHEAATAMIDYVRRELDLKVLRASTDACNRSCVRLLGRLNFIESGLMLDTTEPLRVFKLAV